MKIILIKYYLNKNNFYLIFIDNMNQLKKNKKIFNLFFNKKYKLKLYQV